MRSTQLAAALALAGALTVASACAPPRDSPSPESGTTAPSSDGGSTCPITSPDPGSPLPAGLPAEGDSTWYGTGPLWTDLGNFAAPVPRQDGALRIKHAWWTGDDSGAPVSEHGPPTVTAHPLDGGETVEATVGSYATTGSDGETFAWWPTVLEFPSAGCWEITGDWEGSTLTAVVLLTDADETED